MGCIDTITDTMNNLSNLEEKIETFSRIVQKYFKFLETDYGLIKGKLKKYNFNEPRDALVSIRYRGNPVDVEIGWGIGSASIGITLRDNNYLVSQKREALKTNLKPIKVVDFETAVEYLTNGKEKPIIPEISKNISFEEIKRNADKRQQLINQSMEDIVKHLAEKLKKYGDGIIKGNTDQFPEVDKYYTKKYY